MERDKTSKKKLEKNSRRSSILKGSQSGATSAECKSPSPARLKRRVSFAEKKHVKEFCDSIEQGTVWDNTYEESDTSHRTRSHHEDNSIPQACDPICDSGSESLEIYTLPPSHPKKRVPCLTFLGPYTEENPQFIDKENIPIDPMANLNESFSPHKNPEKPQKFAIYCDEENSSLENAKNPELEDPTLSLSESKCLLTDDEEETALLKKTAESLVPNNPRRSIYDGMEMTESLQSVLTVGAAAEISEKNIFANELTKNFDDDVEETEVIPSICKSQKSRMSIFNSDGMEMTEAICSIPNFQKAGRKSILNSDGMEMTEAICSVPNFQKAGRKSILNSDGMEMTEAICSVPNFQKAGRKSILNSDGMEMTEAICSIPNLQKAGRKSILNSDGMEMTEAICSVPNFQKAGRKSILNSDGMEMTEAICSIPNLKNAGRKSILNSDGMEMTEGICSIPNFQKAGRKSILNSDGMEMTEAICSVPNLQKAGRKSILNSDGMEMTEAICSVPLPKSGKRKSFSNCDGMEMTEAISSLITSKKPRRSVLNSDGMEMTEVINGILPDDADDKTKFLNQELEMTEAIASLPPASPSPVAQPIEEPDQAQDFIDLMEVMQLSSSVNRAANNLLPGCTTSQIDSELLQLQKYYSDKNPFQPPIPSEQDRQCLHRILHPELEAEAPDLQSQSMEFTSAIGSSGCQKFQDFGEAEDSTETTASIPELSEQPQAVAADDLPLQSSSPKAASPEMDSCDSLKENQSPGNPPRLYPVARPLFESQEVTIPITIESPALEVLRSIPTVDRKLEDMTAELTSAIIKPQDDFALCSSSTDIQNISTPSFIFVDSSSDDNTLPKSTVTVDNEEADIARDDRVEITGTYGVLRVGDQEMTCNIGPVPIPEVDFTEEITNVQDPKERLIQSEVDEDIVKSRRTFTVLPASTSESTVESGEHLARADEVLSSRRTFTIVRDRVTGTDDSTVSLSASTSTAASTSTIAPTSLVMQIEEDAEIVSKRRTFTVVHDAGTTSTSASTLTSRNSPVIHISEDEEIERKRRTFTIPPDADSTSASTSTSRKFPMIQMSRDEEIEIKRRTFTVALDRVPEVDAADASTSASTLVTRGIPEMHTEESGEVLNRGKTFTVARDESPSANVSASTSTLSQVPVVQEDDPTIANNQSTCNVGDERTVVTSTSASTFASTSTSTPAISSTPGEPSVRQMEVDPEIPIEEGTAPASNIPISTSPHKQLIDQTVMESIMIVDRLRKMQKRDEARRKRQTEQNLHKSTEGDVEEDEVEELTPFEAMKKNLLEFSGPGCIWRPFRIEPTKVFVDFVPTAFRFGVTFHLPQSDEREKIKEYFVLPRLNAKEKEMVKMTDPLIFDKINRSIPEWRKKFSSYDDVLPLIVDASADYRFIYHFYGHLRSLALRVATEIDGDRVALLLLSQSKNTILKVFVNIKPFQEIGPQDVEVLVILGNISVSDIKALMLNVKKTSNFLTMYKNDVLEYMELMELSRQV